MGNAKYVVKSMLVTQYDADDYISSKKGEGATVIREENKPIEDNTYESLKDALEDSFDFTGLETDYDEMIETRRIDYNGDGKFTYSYYTPKDDELEASESEIRDYGNGIGELDYYVCEVIIEKLEVVDFSNDELSSFYS